MSLKNSLEFLGALAENNNKEWMDANRDWYQVVRGEFISFIDELIKEMQSFEPGMAGLEGKKCVFRINRDIRFSNDKRPYKTNFGAAISEGGRKSGNPMYYFHLQPGENFLGGGFYMPEADILKKIRQEVDYNPEELKKIVEDPRFKEKFGSVQGEKLKTAPKGYPKDHPNLEFLKLKSFTVIQSVSDADAQKESIREKVIDSFRTMQPFNDYLAVAVS